MKKYIEIAKNMRKILHEIPEKSMQETKTRAALKDFLSRETELELVDRGSWFYAAYRGGEGAYTAIRADYDAVTGADGIARHICGHDGHAAALCALAKLISDSQPEKNIILLFQPGEETGEGAKLCSELFELEDVEEIYALHNIPGSPLGQLLLREKTFACGSTGLEISLSGAAAHAAYPESGKNPAQAVSEIVLGIEEYLKTPHSGVLLSTVIGIELGSESYGMSASQGILRLTVRAEYGDEFEAILAFIRKLVEERCGKYGLGFLIKEIERFPATENTPECTEKLRALALGERMSYSYPAEPLRWSEDFGAYLQKKRGAYFGIGAGESCPDLHTEGYCFPDELFGYILPLFAALCRG